MNVYMICSQYLQLLCIGFRRFILTARSNARYSMENLIRCSINSEHYFQCIGHLGDLSLVLHFAHEVHTHILFFGFKTTRVHVDSGFDFAPCSKPVEILAIFDWLKNPLKSGERGN